MIIALCGCLQYLGCVEVFESRGIQVCEEAISVLRNVSYMSYVQCILSVNICICVVYAHTL